MSFQDLLSDMEAGLLSAPSPSQEAARGVFQINTKVEALRWMADALGTPKDTRSLRGRLRGTRAGIARLARSPRWCRELLRRLRIEGLLLQANHGFRGRHERVQESGATYRSGRATRATRSSCRNLQEFERRKRSSWSRKLQEEIEQRKRSSSRVTGSGSSAVEG
ncbi:hypothetical protein GUJ93_ZPchr0006g46454 [Zizania palustris]|uniref:Uncharacterized protein n=1 Tax=Zizania palustris TaxID=103762 RepID=A0A8J5W4Q0_ZIZPA|nr:hypothetical protein GUJ93_ZPchr0006g46454 [Zizania palustris]